MTVASLSGLVLAAGRVGARSHAGTAARQGDDDEKAIRATAEAFTQAFNRGDAKAVAALWTPDGEYVDEDGSRYQGREAIQAEYAALFKDHPKARIRVDIASIRLVGPSMAIEEGTTRLNEPPVGDLSTAHYTVIHTKQDGRWQMASVQDLESAPLSKYQLLRDLEPLIGRWEARSGDTRVETECAWTDNRNFIHRTFKARKGDQVISSGIQLIGVDPSLGEVTSWEFDQDGGTGRGLWHQDGGRWVIEAQGFTGTGQETMATNTLAFVNKDTFTWQSTDRTLDGAPVADVPLTKITRRK
jgi:uncharacterized protein (TIGR02246 family)